MKTSHGTILGGLVSVPDLDQGLAAYADVFGLELVEQTALPGELAASWGCPAIAGAPYAALRPSSGAPCWFRLVEQPPHPDFRPATTYGWAAFEASVADVWHWPRCLPQDLFEIVGPPRMLENIKPAFIPMQVLGPGREMIYLNQVLADMDDTDLPKASAPVDRIFIAVLAAGDREKTVAWYVKALGLECGATYRLAYSVINKAFSLPPETLTSLTMIRHGRMPIVEVDQYPAEAMARPCHPGMLPPGNALVTLAVRDLDACKTDWIAPPGIRREVLYEGRRAATTIGPAGELIECVETGL